MWVYLFGLLLVAGIGAGAEFGMAQQPYIPSWDAAWRLHLICSPALPFAGARCRGLSAARRLRGDEDEEQFGDAAQLVGT